MCQYSGSVTTHEVKKVVGLKSMLSKFERPVIGPSPRSQIAVSPTLTQHSQSTRHAGTAPPTHFKAWLTMPIAVPLHNDTIMDTHGVEQTAPDANNKTPVLTHRMKHDKSILALAVSSQYIFAGTQGGEILVRTDTARHEACIANCSQVYSLDTYERRRVIQAHKGSVLGLCLSQDQELLFSSAADPIVNVRTTC